MKQEAAAVEDHFGNASLDGALGDELAAVRQKLANLRTTAPLFDTKRFCRNLEAAYQSMWDKHRKNEAPRAFAVADQS